MRSDQIRIFPTKYGYIGVLCLICGWGEASHADSLAALTEEALGHDCIVVTSPTKPA